MRVLKKLPLEQVLDQRFQRWFFECPGAWYGNMPGSFGPRGNITVDVTKIVEAILFLSKRLKIVGSRLSSREEGAVVLEIEWKDGAA